MFQVKTRILPSFPAHTLRPVCASFQLPYATFPMSSAGSAKFDFSETLLVKTKNYE